jgi:WD40 repeat protein/class 3 adenylate cyclase
MGQDRFVITCPQCTLRGPTGKEIRRFGQIRLPTCRALGWNACAPVWQIDFSRRAVSISIPSASSMPAKSNAAPKDSSSPADEVVRKNLPQGVTLVRTLRGHTAWIGRIAWSLDGRMLASPSADQTIRLWDAGTGECLRILKGHKGSICSVDFDPSSGLLASGGEDNTVKLWDVSSGRLHLTLEGHASYVWSVAFDPMGRQVACGNNNSTIKLWDTASGHLLHTLEGHNIGVLSVAFDPAGRQIASGGYDSTLKLWDSASGHLLHKLESQQSCIYSVTFDPAGRWVASGGDDETVELWDASSGRLLCTLEGHTGSVQSISFSPQGQCLASKGRDRTIRVWKTESGDCIAIIPVLCSDSFPPGLAFHPRLPLLATVCSDPGVPKADRNCVIHIYELDLDLLLRKATDQSADQQRSLDAFVLSAKDETSTMSFLEWAGGERVTLGIVFTDVVGSTALGEEIKDEAMNKVRGAHFDQSRKLIGKFHGREIKTIGDSFMVAFKCANAALDFVMALQRNTGHPSVQIRAGIHIGPMQVAADDVFGGTVNFAARVVGAIKGAEIWLSDRAKDDITSLGAAKHKMLKWEPHIAVPMKGFSGGCTLWSCKVDGLRSQ